MKPMFILLPSLLIFTCSGMEHNLRDPMVRQQVGRQLLSAITTGDVPKFGKILAELHKSFDLDTIKEILNQQILNQIINLIHEAACHAKNFLAILINEGVDVNVKTDGGWTALHFACVHGKSSNVKLLLEHGADRTACNFSMETPRDLLGKYPAFQSAEANAEIMHLFNATSN